MIKGGQCIKALSCEIEHNIHIHKASQNSQIIFTVLFVFLELTFCINVGNTFKDNVDFLSNWVHCPAQCHGEVVRPLRRLVGFPRCLYWEARDAPSWSVGIDQSLCDLSERFYSAVH